MNFFKNFSIYGLVPVISKSIGFLLIPIYTRYLTVSEFGIQDVFLVFQLLATYFIAMELYSGVGRYFYYYNNSYERKNLISSAFTFQLITSIIIIFFLIFFHSFFYETLVGERGYKDVYWIVISWIPFSAMIGFFSVIIRYDNKGREFLFITIIQLLIKVLLTIYLIVKLNYGVKGIFIGQLVGSIVGCIGYFILLREYFYLYIDKNMLLKIFKYSIPLIPGLLIVGAEPNITRYLIRVNLSNVDLGYFALGIRVVSLFSIIGVALRMTWQPFFFENAKKSLLNLNKKVIDIFNLFLYFLLCLSLIISLFSLDIVKIIAPDEYYESAKIIGILSLSIALNIISQIASIGINYVNKTYLISVINILSTFIVVLGLALYLKPYGLMVIPFSFLFGSIIRLSFSMFYSIKFMRLNFQYVRIFALVFFSIVLNLIILKFPMTIVYKILISLFLIIPIYYNRNNILLNIRNVK